MPGQLEREVEAKVQVEGTVNLAGKRKSEVCRMKAPNLEGK